MISNPSGEYAFEWHDHKNLKNIEKHNVSFSVAASLWSDCFVQSPAKTVDGEDRFFIIGKSEDTYLTVIFTMRGHKIRIISARRSRDVEREKYDKHFHDRDP